MTHLRLVHSQPAEDCVFKPQYRRATLAFILAVLLVLAIDGLAIYAAYQVYKEAAHYAKSL